MPVVVIILHIRSEEVEPNHEHMVGQEADKEN